MKTPPKNPILERPVAVPSPEASAVATMRAHRSLVRDLMADGGGRHQEVPEERHITPSEAVDDLMGENPTALMDLLRQTTRLPQVLHIAAEQVLRRISGRENDITVIVAAIREMSGNNDLLFAVHAAMTRSHDEEIGFQIAS